MSTQPHRPNHGAAGAVDLAELQVIFERLAHVSGISLPPQRPKTPAEMLRQLTALVDLCGKRFSRDRSRNRALLEVEAQRQQVESMQDEFLRNVTHELRTPLASIKGFAAALIRDEESPEPASGSDGNGNGHAERARYLAIINQEAQRLGELIEDMLALTEIESHARPHVPSLFGAKAAFEQACATFRQRWHEKAQDQLRIELENPPEGPLVYADENDVQEVLRHLLDNAYKFSDGKEITLGAAADGPAPPGERPPRTRIWIRDRGMGIPEVELERIFAKFYRIETAVHTIPGTGLGLAIVKALTSRNAGWVRVQSEVARGTTFTVLLPAHPSEAERT
ncbi:MAG: HAMP domain-containing histidine kinase [Planctomycetes bacterium]|nr:HAMP domain-containing histidine kinase [Planctomycetota bacterium]